MTNEQVWELVLSNERLLRREVRRHLVPGADFDECWSDVVIARAVDIMKTYRDGLGTKPITHLCANVRWYTYKWCRRRKHKELPENIPVYSPPSEDLFDGLDEADRLVLQWYFVDGFTYGEIAESQHCTVACAKDMVATALNAYKALHGQM